MKTKYIISLIGFLPLTAFAGFDVVGTPDGGDTGSDGDVISDNKYVFEMSGGSISAPTSKMLGISDVQGEWWVGNDSSAPWSVFQDDAGVTGNATGANTHPSFHVTDDLVAGQSFYVGLSMQNQMKEYTSNFRITNNLLPSGTDIYFGLRNGGVPSVLIQDGNGDPVVGRDGYINNHDGFDFQGSSTGSGGVDANPLGSTPDTPLDETQFEWIHYKTNGSDSTTFSLITGQGLYDNNKGVKTLKIDPTTGEPYTGLLLTEWVAYFVLPAGMATIDGEAWGDDPLNSAVDKEAGMVFSWTVDAKSGYGPQNWPGPNPDTQVFPVPEPSSAFLLFSAASLMLLRRNRKAA